MYEAFFGLRQPPFSIAPDPHYLFMSERHREALAHLLYGVGGGGGFVLLSGEIGAGKTTVCRCFLEQVPAGCQVAYVFNPKLTVIELLQSVCDEFGIAPGLVAGAAPTSVKPYIDALNRHLLAAHAQGHHCVLIIDEAQNLSAEVLEQLRLLTNLETSERKLLQIMLIGQPELRSMLAGPGLEQLAQRVIARYHLGPLTEPETAAYLGHRLAVAGRAAALPFDAAALRRMHALSAGVPRRINLLADRALLGAYAQGQAVVTRRVVEQAAREVFDNAQPDRQPGRRRWWMVVGICLVGAVLVGLLWWPTTGLLVAKPAPAAALAGLPAALSAAVPVSAASAARPVAAAPWPAAASTPAALRDAEGVNLATAASPANAAASTPVSLPPDLSSLPQDDTALWRELAGLWGLDAATVAAADPCQAVRPRQLRCFRSSTSTLAQLRQLDRPGLLLLHLPDGPPQVARLVALDAQQAVLAGPRGTPEITLTISNLTRWWRGEYATLWLTPTGYAEVLQPGARGTAVDALARGLAALNHEPSPAPGQVLAGALAARLAAFQVAQSQRPDGLAGPTTFMQLNRATGVAEPRLRRLPPER